MENKICLQCGKPLTGESQLFCEDCLKRAIEDIKNNTTDEWTLSTVIFFAGIFGWDGEQASLDKLKELFDKDD